MMTILPLLLMIAAAFGFRHACKHSDMCWGISFATVFLFAALALCETTYDTDDETQESNSVFILICQTSENIKEQ